MNTYTIKLLDAVTANGSGGWMDCTGKQHYTILQSTTGTVGGTITIETKDSDGVVYTIDSKAWAAAGTDVASFQGAFRYIRATLASRTNGTFTVSLQTV